jgi:hypothetical protein
MPSRTAKSHRVREEPHSCGSCEHRWKAPHGGGRRDAWMILPAELGPWYLCRRCHFATSPLLQPKGWKP